MNPLTRKQRSLVRELDEIAALLHLNYREIREYDRDSRSTRLELIKRHFIRGDIVIQYTLMDEFLSAMLCHHFFGRRVSFPTLWKSKRFRNFNYFFLEKLSLMEKLAYVKAIHEVPRTVCRNLEQLNNLRNGIAHAFFPENLRSAKPKWKGLDIFSLEGVQRFSDDLAEVTEFFHRRVFGA